MGKKEIDVLPTTFFLDFTKDWLKKNYPYWEVNNGLVFRSVNSFRIVQLTDTTTWRFFLELYLFGEIVANVETTLSLIGRYSVRIECFFQDDTLQKLRKAYIRQFPADIEIVHTNTIPTNY